MQRGYFKAEKLAKQGKIFYTHRFKHKVGDKVCEGYAFPYGGSMVCNDCGQKALEQDWWIIKVIKDGGAYCCHGLDFTNLQESDNYAFGDSIEEAIANYEIINLQNK